VCYNLAKGIKDSGTFEKEVINEKNDSCGFLLATDDRGLFARPPGADRRRGSDSDRHADLNRHRDSDRYRNGDHDCDDNACSSHSDGCQI
jgi:hypothetical protein